MSVNANFLVFFMDRNINALTWKGLNACLLLSRGLNELSRNLIACRDPVFGNSCRRSIKARSPAQCSRADMFTHNAGGKINK